MIKIKNVLVATDFSEPSLEPIRQGRALAAAFDGSLHLLHVVTEPLHETWVGYAPAVGFLEAIGKLRDEAKRRLELLAPFGPTARERVVIAAAWGDPSDEILKYAANHDIDLIVCGTHGWRGWEHIMMGSVAERVVRLARCPVLTVRGDVRQPAAAA